MLIKLKEKSFKGLVELLTVEKKAEYSALTTDGKRIKYIAEFVGLLDKVEE